MTLWTAADGARILRAPDELSHKYSRGVVGMITGSPAYPGAAVLGVSGAWRTGAGLVRWIGDPAVGAAVLARRPETVLQPGRVTAWVVGSGIDPADAAGPLRDLPDDVPVVIDAGALEHVAAGHGAPRMLTPHAGEFARLAARIGYAVTGDVVADACAVAALLDVVVVHKGATTVLADAAGTVFTVRAGTHWAATGGTGDVLAGAIGTVLAQRPDARPIEAAATGVWLHARAAALAAGSGHPIVAMDVAEQLPAAVAEVLAHG